MTMFDNISLSKTAFCLDQGILNGKLYFFLYLKVCVEMCDWAMYGFSLVPAASFPRTERPCFQEYMSSWVSQDP